MKYLPLLLFVFTFGTLQAQQTQILDESYFSDTTYGVMDKILDYIEVSDGILIAAANDTASSETPYIVKLDLNGEVEWSTLETIQPIYNSCRRFSIELFEEGYIYGASANYISGNDRSSDLWKVDVNTGEVIWRNTFYVNTNYLSDIEDYDATRYLMSYSNDQDNPTFAFIDKSNGDTLQTSNFSQSYATSAQIAVDHNKNIYFSFSDSLFKFNSDDPHQIIWKRIYYEDVNEMNKIYEIYMDQYDDLFVFGGNGFSSSGQGICVKVDINTGKAIWNKLMSYGSVYLADFKDKNDKIYAVYSHSLVGGGSYNFRAVKFGKQNGTVDWLASHNMNALGSPVPAHSGNSDAARALDVDCNGDVYLTGYYGDANYGPEQWGIMKLNGNNGDKVYDLTITLDSLNYDDYSTGRGLCVFGDSPVIIGHQDELDGMGGYHALYVTLEPTTGEVLVRKRIGSEYQHFSRTIDIQEYADKTYAFKQLGKSVVVEQYDANQTLEWSSKIDEPAILFAEQLSIDDNTIYFSSRKHDSSQFSPYYQSETTSLHLYEMDRLDGTILDRDSLIFNAQGVHSIELESDPSGAYLFYKENNDIKYVKWSSSNFSSPEVLEAAGPNTEFPGKLNLIHDYDANSLYALGANQLYSIDKNSLSKSVLFTYSTGEFYDHVIAGDTLFMCGKDPSGNQFLNALNLINGDSFWTFNTNENGEFVQILSDNTGYLYTAGKQNNHLTVSKILQLDGSESWTNFLDTITYPTSQPYDLLVNTDRNYVAVSGAVENTNGSNDAVIYFNELQDNNSDSIIRLDEINSQSISTCLHLLDDNSILAGGSHNRISFSKQGFIYRIDYYGCDYIQSSIINNSDTLIAPSGSYDYQWFDCSTNTPIPGETAQYFYPTSNGIYAVEVTSGLCSSTSDCEVVNDLGVDENSKTISIYPNPTNGEFKILSDANITNVVVYDMLNNIILDQEIDKNELLIDLSGKSKGVYVCKVKTVNGTYTKRIIKQ